VDYRDAALKLYPHLCGRCGRAFTISNLHELTVHHRDHDHSNNPADGSNWELLCLYCHDNEHQKQLELARQGPSKPKAPDVATGQPFSELKNLLASKDRK
jgi:5-methylcytosine-specific restriction endonuclease McrA